MADIFISHSVVDKELANYLCDAFEANGVSCWIAPRNIVPGTEWADSITNAISDCSVLLVVYSQNSIKSSQVAKEIGMADRKHKYIIPYKIDDTEPEGAFDYYLSGCQWIIPNLKTGDYKIPELCQVVKNVVMHSKVVTHQSQNVVQATPVQQVPPRRTEAKPSAKVNNTPAKKERKKFSLGIAGIVAVVCIALVIGIVSIVSIVSIAKKGNADDFEYAEVNGKILITSYIGTESEVVIPSKIDGVPVGALEVKAFFDNDVITSVKLPDTIDTIPGYAFYECSNLTEVFIPDSVEVIGIHAFEDCTSLIRVDIPDSVIKIDDFAFNNCTNLSEIKMSDSAESIGMYAFTSCDKLSSIDLPDTLVSVGDMSFAYCTSLTEVRLPASVQNVPENAFAGCENVTIIR